MSKDERMAQGAKEVQLPPNGVNNSIEAGKGKSVVQRAKALAQWVWNGSTPAEQWFGPGQPMTPVAPQEVEGRVRDYPMTANLGWTPRAEELTPFEELYALSNAHDLTRLCIETRKDQISAQKWTIRKRTDGTGKAKFGPTQEDLVQFFKSPDKRERWQQWIGRILEDLFVADCPTIYVRKALDGSVFGFEPIDGSTIVLRLDPWGRVPLEGEAYVQRLKGLPAVAYSREQLIYSPRRPRNQKGYGLSPVEQIMLTVNMSLKRQLHQLAWYTHGSMPDLIIGTPLTWSETQTARLASAWQSLYNGNSAQKRGRPMLVPGGNECKFENVKADPLKDEFDEWLARIVCFAFSLPPTPFVKMMNRGTAQTAQETAQLEGIQPLMDWVKELHDDMLARMGHADCEFTFLDQDAIDPLVKMQVFTGYVAAGILTKDEVRDRLGFDPLPEEEVPEPVPPVAPPPGGKAPIEPDPAAIPPESQDASQKSAQGPRSFAEGQDGVAPSPAPDYLAKKMKALDRNRPAIIKTQHKLAKIFKAKFAKDLASAIAGGASADKFAKAETIDPKLKATLAALYKDGASEAGKQIGIQVGLPKISKLSVAWAKEHAGELITGIDDTTRESINGLLAQAVETGMDPADLTQALRDNYAFSDVRAEMISRTESAFADVAGNVAAYREGGVTGKSWISDGEGCEECQANADEGVIGFDDTFSSGDDFPPAHPNCLLGDTIVSAAGISKEFHREFHGEVITLTVEGDLQITGTPNHPVLTQRGWVALSEVIEGDEMFKASDPGRLVSLINPDDHHIQTRIDEIASSLRMNGSVFTTTVPPSPIDFHGDGSIDQDVHIVGTERGLGLSSETSLPEDVNKFNLSGGLVTDTDGLPSLVSAVKVTKLSNVKDFTGHVYNLSTRDGWYLANSLIVHNCRCDVIPEMIDVTQEEPTHEE